MLLAIALSGCGRVGFDATLPTSDAADAADGAGADGFVPGVPGFVQSRTWANFGSGAPQSIPATSAGSFLAIAIDVNSSTQTVAGITDNAGDVFVNANVSSTSTANPGGAVISEIWYAANVAGGATTITITSSGGADLWDATVIEATGISSTAPLDGTLALSNISGPTTNSHGGPIVTTQANTMVVVLNAATGVVGLAGGSTFSNIATGGNDNVAYLIGAHPAGTYAVDWDCSAPCGQYNISAVGFAAR